ncbi:sigma-54 dependent transcriptional regulator [Bacteroides sp.]|uniref:sigma-54-dependent transcriptional regulator n=1 Tax=Bacteroides sp. TaxID=29523 RepID=UPI0023CCEA0B|nr:sigma-54 dependent transcriptional regulator [Bacteroides sp.]MDE6216407.1 sigma-54 dependent transcriptional regulator [Bacteroides sp.]
MQTSTILIVDDNKSVLTSLELLLEREFEKIETVSDPNQIFPILEEQVIDLVILDMNFSVGFNTGNEGLFWLQRIHEMKPELPVIMLTAYGDIDLVVKSLKNGAADFVLKPWNNDNLIKKIRATLQETRHRLPANPTKGPSEPAMIIGHSPAMMKIIKLVTKVAKTDANILIYGENGTGKEILAREIHRLSLRSRHELFHVDMGAISESLFESELFGHEKGAFTDAHESRIGKFEAASGSTLFLDEISNLSVGLQAKLLVALQNREITRLGSNKKIPIDIRLIAATNRNLHEMVKQTRFREDLFYRINTIQIEIPPLRHRKEDIAAFAEYFLKKYASLYKRPGLTLHPKTLDKLENHHWPGNIRELQYTMEKAVILTEKDVIRPSEVSMHSDNTFSSDKVPHLKEVERKAILTAISQNAGNLTATAEQLGISRQTLYNKLTRFNF